MAMGFMVIIHMKDDVHQAEQAATLKGAHDFIYLSILHRIHKIDNLLQQRFLLDDVDADNFDSVVKCWNRYTGETFLLRPFDVSVESDADVSASLASLSAGIRAKWKEEAKRPDPQFKCPCCGKVTIVEGRGYYEICRVCSWEDDGIDDAGEYSEVNRSTLAEAREVYLNSVN